MENHTLHVRHFYYIYILVGQNSIWGIFTKKKIGPIIVIQAEAQPIIIIGLCDWFNMATKKKTKTKTKTKNKKTKKQKQTEKHTKLKKNENETKTNKMIDNRMICWLIDLLIDWLIE